MCRSVSGDTVEGPPGLEESSRTVETDVIGSVAHFTATGPRQVGRAHRAAVAALTRMTASTDWPRIGPAAYRATTQENDLRREANPELDEHLTASPQVVESVSRTLSRWRHGFEPRWDYAGQRPCSGVPMTSGPALAPPRKLGPSPLKRPSRLPESRSIRVRDLSSRQRPLRHIGAGARLLRCRLSDLGRGGEQSDETAQQQMHDSEEHGTEPPRAGGPCYEPAGRGNNLRVAVPFREAGSGAAK
jgi:hypothetical protein